jgi:hypothetical protein
MDTLKQTLKMKSNFFEVVWKSPAQNTRLFSGCFDRFDWRGWRRLTPDYGRGRRHWDQRGCSSRWRRHAWRYGRHGRHGRNGWHDVIWRSSCPQTPPCTKSMSFHSEEKRLWIRGRQGEGGGDLRVPESHFVRDLADWCTCWQGTQLCCMSSLDDKYSRIWSLIGLGQKIFIAIILVQYTCQFKEEEKYKTIVSKEQSILFFKRKQRRKYSHHNFRPSQCYKSYLKALCFINWW